MSQIPESVRRRLQAEQPGEHPDADMLTAFSEHALAGAERDRVLAHLGACASCREVVALAMPQEVAAEPAPAPQRRSWFRWPSLRWVAAGAAAVVVAAAVITEVPLRRAAETQVATQPAVSADKAAPAENKTPAAATGASSEVTTPVKKARPAEKPANPAAPPMNARALDAKPGGFPSQQQQVMVETKRGPATEAENIVVSSNAPARADMKDEIATKPAMADVAKGKSGAVFGGAVGGAGAASRAQVAGVSAGAPAAATAAPQSAPLPPPPPQAMQAMRQSERAPATVLRKSSTLAVAAPRWRISSTGQVESTSDGKTWEEVDIDPAVTFRAISANGTDVWAGGAAGALFHTTDGRVWRRVKVGTEGMWVSDTIVSVDFIAPTQGAVTTDHHATWVTADGGRTWERR